MGKFININKLNLGMWIIMYKFNVSIVCYKVIFYIV